MGKDLFVISDLHIGDGGPRDLFSVGGRAEAFRAFVEDVLGRGAELFVLGDLFELWQVNFSRLMLARRGILDALASPLVTYVPGNHDIDLTGFVGTDFLAHPFFRRMSLPFDRVLGGKRFRFFHGHEVDPLNNSESPGWGHMLSVFAGICKEENRSPVLSTGEPVEQALSDTGDALVRVGTQIVSHVRRNVLGVSARGPRDGPTPAQSPGRVIEHARLVRDDLRARGHHVSILGHTHKPGRIGGWYFNSGTWTAPFNPYLHITEDGEVRYCVWERIRGQERPMPEALPEAVLDAPPHAPGRHPRRLGGPSTFSAGLELLPEAERIDLFHPRVWRGLLATALGVVLLATGSSALRVLEDGLLWLFFLDAGLALESARRARFGLLRTLHLVHAAASAALGALAVVRPLFTAEVAVFLMGVWFSLIGAIRAAVSWGSVGRERQWLLLGGAVEAALGIALVLGADALGPRVRHLIAVLFIVHGAAALGAAYHRARVGKRSPRGIPPSRTG